MITEYTVPLYCSMLWEKPLMTQVMSTAPTTPPQTYLSPPTSIMTMGRTEAANEKFCGETAMYTKANRPPAIPQNTALKMNARSFQLALRTPSVEEAISLTARPRRALPTRYLRRRATNNRIMMPTTHTM